MALTHDELCQIACRFLQNNGFKVAFHYRFVAYVGTGEQPDAIGFRNLASCLIEVKCSRAECLLHEASEVYRAYNKTQLPDGDLVDGQSLQEVWDAINATPATDSIYAGIKADGVEMFALMFAEEAIKDDTIAGCWKARASRAASEYAELLREGAK